MASRSVTVQYRRVEPFGSPSFSTSDFDRLIANALAHEVGGVPLSERAVLRQMPADGAMRLLNKHQTASSFVFGELVRYEPGALAPLINQNPEASELNLLQQAAVDEHEFVQGLIYFMARGPHLAIIERGMRTRQLEDYLTWLLQLSGELKTGQRPVLNSRLEVKGTKGLKAVKRARLQLEGRADEVPAVSAKTAALAELSSDLKGGQDVEDHRGFGVAEGETAWRILDTLNITDAAFTEEASKPGTKLKLDVSFSLKRSRSHIELPEETLKDFLEGHPDSEVVLEGKDSRRIGTALLLKRRADVAMNGVYIDQKAAAEALFAALNAFEEQINQAADDPG